MQADDKTGAPAYLARRGVLEPDGSCRRGTFVIDPEGIVRHAAVSDGSVGRSGAETLRVVRALRTGELCPGQPYLLAA